ncbi:MAG: hypothetical protein CL932_04885 [Deltaproteobacteria bacterium]|nr:hypothetical protein [Deltaproteobacteria bacterium]
MYRFSTSHILSNATDGMSSISRKAETMRYIARYLCLMGFMGLFLFSSSTVIAETSRPAKTEKVKAPKAQTPKAKEKNPAKKTPAKAEQVKTPVAPAPKAPAKTTPAAVTWLTPQNVGLILGLGGLFILLLIIFIKANLVICQPNEVVVISGRKRKLEDGTVVGYRILKGGRSFKWPIYESVRRISLTNMAIEIRLHKALAKGIIPMNVDGRANVKIAGSEADGLSNAIERFLGRHINEVAEAAKDAIEGSLRGVIATETPEDANSKRADLAKRVSEEAREDLRHLGIVLDFFKIQNISDDQGYLEAIARKKNAEVKKNANIAEATAEAESRKVAAEQKRIGRIAEAEADTLIRDAENKLAVHTAELELETNRAKERATMAQKIAHVEEQTRLEEGKLALNQKKFEAEVVIPARAEKEANELKAQGKSAKILENGRAMAEAIELMKAQWEDGKTRDLFLIQMLPELLDKVTKVIADNLHIDKVTVLDSGDGNGLPNHVKNLTNSAVTILENLKNTTGVDLADVLKSKPSELSGKLPKELD